MKLSELNEEIRQLNEWVNKIGDPSYDPEIYLEVDNKEVLLSKVSMDFNLGPVKLKA